MADTSRPARLHHQSVGVGSPIVLCHGLGDDSSAWSELAALLSLDHTVITWDLRGHGRSEALSDPAAYTMQAGLRDLQAIISGAGPRVDLVGHSLGGYLALALALQRPDLVRTLTLIASGPGYRDAEGREAWNSYVDTAVLSMPIAPIAAGLARQSDSWVIDHLPDLEPPLLVMVGERDKRFLASASFFERKVPSCSVHVIGGAGHHPQRAHAAEVAALTLDHINQAG